MSNIVITNIVTDPADVGEIRLAGGFSIVNQLPPGYTPGGSFTVDLDSFSAASEQLRAEFEIDLEDPNYTLTIDPLDVETDGQSLRWLLMVDQQASQDYDESLVRRRLFTPAQREAVSAHWAAELRAKVAAAKPEPQRVLVDLEDE